MMSEEPIATIAAIADDVLIMIQLLIRRDHRLIASDPTIRIAPDLVAKRPNLRYYRLLL